MLLKHESLNKVLGHICQRTAPSLADTEPQAGSVSGSTQTLRRQEGDMEHARYKAERDGTCAEDCVEPNRLAAEREFDKSLQAASCSGS